MASDTRLFKRYCRDVRVTRTSLFKAPEKAREGFEHEEAPKLENGKSVAVGRREIPIHLFVRNFRCRRPRPISIPGDQTALRS